MTHGSRAGQSLAVGLAVGVLPASVATAAIGSTEQVVVGRDGSSSRAAVSDDGRYVVFDSQASNLVVGDTNDRLDVFVHDRENATTERVSVSTSGVQGNDSSLRADVSADGRYVVFESSASNLVARDTNGSTDIFVHDREQDTTVRVSLAGDGAQADSSSFAPAISADGRHVVFESFATNLVADDGNENLDVFVHDRQTGTTERVSVAADGGEGDSASFDAGISDDGRYVVFESFARLFAGDGNGTGDVVLRDTHADGVDSTPPVWPTVPDQVVDATGAHGGRLAFDPAVTDDIDTDPVVTCIPSFRPRFHLFDTARPGAVFRIGRTPVRCGATDSAGNTSSIVFTVTVRGAGRQVADLAERIDRLPAETALGLRRQLVDVRRLLRQGELAMAYGRLAELRSAVASAGFGAAARQPERGADRHE